MRWFLLLSLAVQLVSGKIFDKCELADVLENTHKMPRDQVKSWVCIAEHESTFNTEAVNRFKNWDGSKDYGLFQLNNKYWCKDEDENPAFQNVCRMPCSKLTDADLTDDLVCIKKIIRGTEAWKGKGTGLTAWVAYVTKCQNRNLDEYMSECWAEDNTINTREDSVIGLAIVDNARVPIIPMNTINVRVDTPEDSVVGSAIVDNARVPIIPMNTINVRVDTPMDNVVGPGKVDNIRVPIIPMTSYFHFFQPQQPILIPQQPLAASPSAHHIIYQPQMHYQQLYKRV